MIGGWRRAEAKAALFVQSMQLESGGFESLSSPTKAPFRGEVSYQTTFVAALILQSLSQRSDPVVLQIRAKLAAWLLAQKSANWSFNYWPTNASQRAILPYPDDLDDTACALIALYKHDRSLITQECLANIVKLLIPAESQVGGPYRTWLVAPTAPAVWQDIDLAVNSNIAYFLSLIAPPLPNLTSFMEQAISSQHFYSPYYPSAYPLIYYLARAYHGPQSAALASYLLARRRNGWWGSPLRTAWAVSALASLGQASHCTQAMQQVVAMQQPNGSWEAEAFCLDPAIKGRRYFSGCAALTTALVLEAMAHFHTPVSTATPRAARPDSQAVMLQAQISRSAIFELDSLDTDLRKRAQHAIKRMQEGDKRHEITLLPYFFQRSLATVTTKASHKQLVELGLASMYGWVAYTIYDDFLDEAGTPALLSVANTCMRYSLRHFRRALPRNMDFQDYTEHTFDSIDAANAWELAHCRFLVTKNEITIGQLPRYGHLQRLAERSLGHTLTPLGILAANGLRIHGREAQAVSKAFKHYLIARQLHDDLHDWEQDLAAGHITYVVAALCKRLSLQPQTTHNLQTLLPVMQREFWHETLPTICHIILRHTTMARKLASATNLFHEPHIIAKLVDRIETSVTQTLQEQNQAQQFLASYRKKEVTIAKQDMIATNLQ